MMKSCILKVFCLLFINTVFCQELEFCPIQIENIKFDNNDNLPTVTYNSDGTASLEFSESGVTEIFANHVIYDFYPLAPGASGVLSTYYSLEYQSKDLIKEINEKVSPAYLEVENDYSFGTINTDLIEFLQGRQMKLSQYYYSEEGYECTECPFEDAPENFDLILNFNYDANGNALHITSDAPTPCGNVLDITLKTLETNDTQLQLWSSIPAGTVSSEPCGAIENMLYNIFDIACTDNDVGPIFTFFNEDEGSLRLERNSRVFGRYKIIFKTNTLTDKDSQLSQLTFSRHPNQTSLLVTGVQETLLFELINLSGQHILQKRLYTNDSIQLDFLNSGLYLVRIIDGTGAGKTLKLIWL